MSGSERSRHMTMVLHLALVDLRRAWPGLSAVLVLHVLRAMAVEVGPLTRAVVQRRIDVFVSVEPLALLAEVLATLVAVSFVVHRDPLVGHRAFWLTRPIPPRVMFAAKALALSSLVILPVALNAVRLALYDAGATAVLAGSLEMALSRSCWIAAAWLVAAVTPSTRAWLLTLVGMWLAFVVYVGVLFSLRPLGSNAAPTVYVPPLPLPSTAAAWTGMIALLAASIAVLAWQYRARRQYWAAALAIGAVAIALPVRALTPPSLVAAADPTPPAWFTAIRSDDITLPTHRLTARSSATHARPQLVAGLSGRFEIAGIRHGFSTTVIPRTSRISANGRFAEGRGQPIEQDSPGQRLDLVLTASEPSRRAPGHVAAGMRPTDNVDLQVATARDLDPFANREVRADAELEIRLTQHRLFASLPLLAGAAVRHHEALFEILLVERVGHDLVVRIRHARFPSFRPAIAPNVFMAIQEADTGAWSAAPSWPRSVGDQFPGFGLYLSAPFAPYDTPWGGAWQSIHELRVMPPATNDLEAWRRASRLVLLESIYAGRIVRTWSDPGVFVAGTFLK